MGRQGSYSGCSGKGSHLDSHLPQLLSSCGSPRDPLQMLCPYSRPEHIRIAGDMWHRLWIYKHHMVMAWHLPLHLLCMRHLRFSSFIWPFPRSAHLDQEHCSLQSIEMHLQYCIWWVANILLASPCGETMKWQQTNLAVYKVESSLSDYHAVSICIQGRASTQTGLPGDPCMWSRG